MASRITSTGNTSWHTRILGRISLVIALQRATRRRDGSEPLPPGHFRLYRLQPARCPGAGEGLIGGLNEPPPVMDNPLVDLVDLNGDGLPDILRTYGRRRSRRLPEPRRDPDRCHARFSGARPRHRGWPAGFSVLALQATCTWRIWTATAWPISSRTADEEVSFYPNRGNRWGERKPCPPGSCLPGPLRRLNVRTADMDFDKRIDLISGDGPGYQVWFNLGGTLLRAGQRGHRRTVRLVAGRPDRRPQRRSRAGHRAGPDRPRRSHCGPGLRAFCRPFHCHSRHEPRRTAGQQACSDRHYRRWLGRPGARTGRSGQLWYWVNLGNYTLSLRKIITACPRLSGYAAIRWADLNGNGTTDLVYADSASAPRSRRWISAS